MRKLFVLAFCATVVSLSACGVFEDSNPPRYSDKDAQVASFESPSQNASSSAAPLPEFVQILWEIPSEKVEGYLIRYGTDPDNLSHEVKLKPEEVQRVHHQRYGEVFRYLLPNPPRDQTIYVSIAAVGSAGESAPSKVFAVAPEAATPAPSGDSAGAAAAEGSPVAPPPPAPAAP